MKTKIYSAILSLIAINAFSQVGIGTPNPLPTTEPGSAVPQLVLVLLIVLVLLRFRLRPSAYSLLATHYSLRRWHLLTRLPADMPTKTLRILSFLGKAAGLALLLVGPFSGTPVGLTVFAVSSFLKDAVNRIGDLADDGKPNDSFKT